MPDIILGKWTIRRGLDSQRRSVVLEQGEPGYTTDTKRFFIGDGVLSGGNVIGAYVHAPLGSVSARTTLTNAYRGDLIYENSYLWMLSGTDASVLSNWGYIGPKADDRYVTFINNQISLSANSLGADRFAPAAGSGGIIATRNNGLSANPDNITLGVSANKILVLTNSLDENYMKTTSFTKGIQGGAGTKIQLNVNTTQFGFAGGTVLTLSALPSEVVTYDSINPSMIGDGLTLDGTSSTLKANLSGVNATLTNNAGVVGLATITTGDTTPLAEITKNVYGQVTSARSSIAARFSAMDTTNPYYGVLSAFNGYPGQVTGGRIPDLPLTIITVASANASGTSSVNINLSSAGFMTFAGTTTQDGRVIDRVAIPVFTF